MMTRTLSTRRKAAIAGSLGAALLLAGASGAYAYAFAERALPNTSVAGHSVAGMDEAGVSALIADLEAGASVELSVGSAATATPLSELGVDIDEEATARAVLALSDDLLGRFSALVSPRSVEPVVTRDEGAFERFTARLSQTQGPAPVNARVVADADGVFAVEEGAPGVAVDPAPLERAVDAAASTLAPSSAALEVRMQEPRATTEEARAVADSANALIAPEVVLGDGIDEFEATRAEKASWVKLPEIPDEQASPVLDPAAVGAWVEQVAEKTNVAPVPVIDNVDSSGAVLVEEARPGKEGMKANNAPSLASALVDALNGGADYSATFNYDEVAPSHETRPVMAGYEAYGYPMAEGEKWIDVDLTGNRLTAYEGQTPVLGPYAINHGSPGHETVTGLYHVYLQYEKQDMGCTPEWSYCAKDVPWVSYFTGSYAIHGAPWVSTFGLGSVGGSHGCVNLPVGAAHEVFSWAPLGTPVRSHY